MINVRAHPFLSQVLNVANNSSSDSSVMTPPRVLRLSKSLRDSVIYSMHGVTLLCGACTLSASWHISQQPLYRPTYP